MKKSTFLEYIAAYAFTSQEDGDLSFQAGEVIIVTEMDGAWWRGTAGNRTGIFPANYVSPKPQVSPYFILVSFSDVETPAVHEVRGNSFETACHSLSGCAVESLIPITAGMHALIA